jgi:hypothetical protein
MICLAAPTLKIKVVAPPERTCEVWICHEEDNDAGPGIVHRKCF